MATIKLVKLVEGGILPAYANPGDAGFDLFSLEDITVKRKEIKLIPLGIASSFSSKYFVSFRDKSGLAAKCGIHVLGGVIDSSYRGEWKVILVNLGKVDYKVGKGDKVAQGILQSIEKARLIEVKILKETKRGKGGFGSTGK